MPSKCLALFVRIEYTTEGTHRLLQSGILILVIGLDGD